MRKRWVMLLLAGVGLGFVLMLVVPARPPVEAAVGFEASPGRVERSNEHGTTGTADEGPPGCNLEAGYCPRRPS